MQVVRSAQPRQYASLFFFSGVPEISYDVGVVVCLIECGPACEIQILILHSARLSSKMRTAGHKKKIDIARVTDECPPEYNPVLSVWFCSLVYISS